MKYLLIILLTISGNEFSGNISEFNKLKREAEFAFNDERYDEAVEKYQFLIDSLNFTDDAAKLNLAHSYYHMNEIEKSKSMYEGLIASSDKEIKSIAHQQLGLFSARAQDLNGALKHFKQSLLANPENEDSRYNYELIKKKLEDQEEQNQDQENQDQDQNQENQDQKDQENQEQQDQENQDQKDNQQQDQEQEDQEQEQKDQKEQNQNSEEGEDEKEQKQSSEEQQNEEENKDQQAQNAPNFDEKEISKEMAEMILQAMQNQEKQYLQQLKKKPTEPVRKDKPDW